MPRRWSGVAMAEVFMAGQRSSVATLPRARKLYTEGLADMERAVALAPNDIAVRVPRASGLLPTARAVHVAPIAPRPID